MDIKGKSAIVTGSAGGIGRATAVMLAQHGAADIALVDVNAAGLAETARLVEADGARASLHRHDLSAIPAPAAWFRSHGDVEIVHTNARGVSGLPHFADADTARSRGFIAATIQTRLSA